VTRVHQQAPRNQQLPVLHELNGLPYPRRIQRGGGIPAGIDFGGRGSVVQKSTKHADSTAARLQVSSAFYLWNKQADTLIDETGKNQLAVDRYLRRTARLRQVLEAARGSNTLH